MPRRINQMRFSEAATEAAGISLANKTMAGGAGAGVLGWLSQVNWMGLIGAAVAIIGLAANIYFQIRRDRREAAESRERIAALRDRCSI